MDLRCQKAPQAPAACGRILRGARTALAALALCTPGQAQAESTPHDAPQADSTETAAFVPRPDLRLSDLEQVVRARSPALQAAELDVETSLAEVRRSLLLPNPVLDGSWQTIPLGDTNPGGLDQAFSRVPSYSIGLSYTFEIGKRGPRQERALALTTAAEAQRDVVAREEALNLAHALGDQATILLRLDGMRTLALEGKAAVALAEERVRSQYGVPLEVDRLRIEVDRTNQQLLDAEGDLNGALAACSALVGAPCRPFVSSEDARRFLSGWIQQILRADGRIEDRPDVRQLDAQSAAASAELSYADALAIPDPTVRVGFLHDRFLIAGNQMDSANVGVTIPLPFFDRGQAQRSAAQAKQARLAAWRQRVVAIAATTIPALRRRIESHMRQQAALETDIIPRAHHVLDALQKAAESRLVAMTDVLQARRALSELLIEEANSYRDAFGAALLLAAELPDDALTEGANK